jgi:hypothetical protein
MKEHSCVLLMKVVKRGRSGGLEIQVYVVYNRGGTKCNTTNFRFKSTLILNSRLGLRVP